MAGFIPAIHVLADVAARKTWMAGTSPAMTKPTCLFSRRFFGLKFSGHPAIPIKRTPSGFANFIRT
jgi:hypothetical protein